MVSALRSLGFRSRAQVSAGVLVYTCGYRGAPKRLAKMFFDAHTHAQFAAFDKDWKEVIDRALSAGVWMINVGTQKDTSRRAIEVARNYPEGVYASVGLHPIHTERSYHDKEELGVSSESASAMERENRDSMAQEFKSRGEEFDYNYYRKLAVGPEVLTIGECGLDYYRLSGETKDKQTKAFEQQIQLASDVKKPLMIHCRSALPWSGIQ